MNIDYEAIGRRIRTRRIQKAMTREQLAALIEREPAYLSRIEHGNQKPSLDTLLRKYSAAMSDVNMVAVQNMIPSAKRLLTRRNKAAIIQTNNKFCRRRLMNIDWNAKGYQKDFAFVPKYGEAVLDLIDAAPGALAVDLGCGNGGLTGKLIERGYRVVGVDASAPMLALAKERYPDTTFLQADACTFQLPEQADVIFSNAVLHWIDAAKQNELIANIASQLKPGGQLVCEFGGKGCAETVHAALEKIFAAHGLTYRRTFYFPTVGEYAPMLERHGLQVRAALLFDRPTPQQTEDGLADWIRMFDKAPFAGVPEELQETIIREAVETLRPVLYHDGHWYVDYVRIRIKAVKEGK